MATTPSAIIQLLREFGKIIDEAVDSTGAPVFTNTKPLLQAIQNVGIATHSIPTFTFDLDDNISIQDVQKEAEKRNVNFLDCFKVLDEVPPGAKPYIFLRHVYDRNYRAPGTTPDWASLSVPEASEFEIERSQVCFRDAEETRVDWSRTLPRLKALAKDRTYTTDMMTECLRRLVNRLDNILYYAEMFSCKEADEIANILLTMEAAKDAQDQGYPFPISPVHEYNLSLLYHPLFL
jgi:hypothetical protein